MGEIWKCIPGYEGLYQVSSLGKVKSLSRIKKVGNGSHMTKEIIRNVNVLSNSGYLVITLNKEGKKKNHKIHQLMAMSFLGHVPCGQKLVVDHINNIKTDNRIENLQIISCRHNSLKNKPNKRKYTGVEKSCNKYRSRITINGTTKNLGTFDNPEDAYKAYKKALKSIKVQSEVNLQGSDR